MAKLYAIADMDSAPTGIMPWDKPYKVIQLAFNYEDRKIALIVEAPNQAGLNQFKDDWGDPQTVGSFQPIANRGDWEMNAFPTFDDGTSDFETIFNKGKEYFERREAQKEEVKPENIRARLDQEERERLAERHAKIYGESE